MTQSNSRFLLALIISALFTAEVTFAADTPIAKKRTVLLPGISKLPADTPPAKGSVIRTNGANTETAFISKQFTNRIATPFEHPRVIDQANANVTVDGSSIFVTAKSDEPFALYVTGKSTGDAVISLTLIPKAIPAQILTLQLDSSQGALRKAGKIESYEQQLVEILKTAALGRTPDGFSEGLMPNFIARQNRHGLNIIPISRYSGASLDVYKYKVENNQSDIELSETAFWQKGVLAVSILPNMILRRGESTTVFVLADKSILDGASNAQ